MNIGTIELPLIIKCASIISIGAMFNYYHCLKFLLSYCRESYMMCETSCQVFLQDLSWGHRVHRFSYLYFCMNVNRTKSYWDCKPCQLKGCFEIPPPPLKWGILWGTQNFLKRICISWHVKLKRIDKDKTNGNQKIFFEWRKPTYRHKTYLRF